MPYTTSISPEAARQINQWGLAEPIWMEVLLRLYQVLPQNPSQHLTALPSFPHGLYYYFNLQDPARSDFIHEFVFKVVYLTDEEHLHVLGGSYWRHVGGLPPT